MRYAPLLSTLVVGLVLVGCSSSEPATTPTAEDTSRSTTSTETRESPSRDTSSQPTEPPAQAPNDWFHLDQASRRLPGLATERAYETILQDRAAQDTVVVAIIDSGIDVDHEDLSAQAWRNDDEIPNNDKDDDGNGYVDDVRGWNFIGGPDGKHVNEDTYELTRLYVDLRDRFAEVDSATVAPENREAYNRYREIEQEFKQKRKQAKTELKNIRKTHDAVQFAETVLKNHLEVETLTREVVDTLSTPNQEIRKARDILLYFFRRDLSPSDVYDYYEHLKRRVEYNYNPDFNPRPLVGDDYQDKSERYYGNNDIRGPDALHGTHVGGIVAATRNNGIGIDGVANAVRILPVRAVPNGDERDKDVAHAIHYAVDNGADVINMSFGKGYSPHKDVVDAAVRRADSMGVLMVHAAGNDGENVDSTDNYPTRRYSDGGRAEHWIEVGASSWREEPDLAAPFSNYGAETVDVFAPGHAIYSTAPDDKYERSDGTSMAAPMVSGVAALIMAYYPTLSPTQVRDIILESATSYDDVEVTQPGSSKLVPFGELSRTGSIVNAYDALKQAKRMHE